MGIETVLFRLLLVANVCICIGKEAYFCYGDSSARDSTDLVNVVCEKDGLILLNNILVGTKPESLGCPLINHITSPANYTQCCTRASGDCVAPFTGDISSYLNCNGKRICKDIAAVRGNTNSTCFLQGGYNQHSNYMIFEYECVPDGQIYGACNASTDCIQLNDECYTADIGIKHCVCESGYTEYNRTCWPDINECSENANNCHANAACTNTPGSFTCACNSGYTGNGVTCTDINECAENTNNCNGNAACSNTPGSFICVCSSGYTGNGVTCTDINECSENANNCHANAACTNTPGMFTCVCSSGYTGNGVTCTDINECAENANNCHANAACTNTPGSFICVCSSGYTGNGVTCTDINECAENANNCHANAACTNTPGSFICVCSSGYTGNGVTCTDINECAENANNCHANAACTNTPGSFTCACSSGYTGNGVTCTDINECSENANNCHANAACTNTPGSFTCACNSGYTGNGVTCTDINECAENANNCHANAACTNTPGSFICVCSSGYTGNGMTCTDINECAENANNCHANAACTNTPGSFTCACDSGYTGNGVTCTDINECAENTNNCNGNAACTNTLGSFTCACNSGYTGNGVTNTPGSFTCACNSGYNGNGGTCTDINECAENTNNCHANAACTNTPGSFTCACSSGYTGNGVTCNDSPYGGICNIPDTPCTDPHAQCDNTNHCQCKPNYSFVTDSCKEDGSSGGRCFDNNSCTEARASCTPDVSSMCDNINCIPGICQCQLEASYISITLGICVMAGEIGGNCNIDKDCPVNAICDADSSVCVCIRGCSNVNNICIEDGYPYGNCKQPDDDCIQYAVCVEGTCKCNDVRNYVKENGVCVKNDTYINGACNTVDKQCRDTQSECHTGLNICVCLQGFVQVNGACTDSNDGKDVPSVTSCFGSSPYNTVDPDCENNSEALVLHEYSVVKPLSASCPAIMDEYHHSNFRDCCTESTEDCRVYTDVASDCDPNLYPNTHTYTVKDYICIPANSQVEIDDDNDITGSPVYVTSPNYPDGIYYGKTSRTCSVQASCETDIRVIQLANDECSQVIEVDGTRLPCSKNNSPYTHSGPYLQVALIGQDSQNNRAFVLKFEAQETGAILKVECGSLAKSSADDSIGSCEDGPGTAAADLLLLIIIVLVVALLFIFIIALCLCRNNIRNKCCSSKEKNNLRKIQSFQEELTGDPEAIFGETKLVPHAVTPVQNDIEDESAKKKKKKKKKKKTKTSYNNNTYKHKFRGAAVGVTAAHSFEDGIRTGTVGTYRRLDEQHIPFSVVNTNNNTLNPPLMHASHQKVGNFSQFSNSQTNHIMPPIPSHLPLRRRTPSALPIPENEVLPRSITPGCGLQSPHAYFHSPPGIYPFAPSFTAGSFRHPGPQMSEAPSVPSFEFRAAWRPAENATPIAVMRTVARGRSTLEIASMDETGIVETTYFY